MCEFSTNVKLSVETLREEIKPVVTEKFEFEFRNESILLSFSGIIGLSTFRPTEQKYWFFEGNTPAQFLSLRLRKLTALFCNIRTVKILMQQSV